MSSITSRTSASSAMPRETAHAPRLAEACRASGSKAGCLLVVQGTAVRRTSMRSGLVPIAEDPRMRQHDDVIHRVLAATRVTGRGGGTLRKGRRRSSKGEKHADG